MRKMSWIAMLTSEFIRYGRGSALVGDSDISSLFFLSLSRSCSSSLLHRIGYRAKKKRSTSSKAKASTSTNAKTYNRSKSKKAKTGGRGKKAAVKKDEEPDSVSLSHSARGASGRADSLSLMIGEGVRQAE